jgi:hypothetical protein
MVIRRRSRTAGPACEERLFRFGRGVEQRGDTVAPGGQRGSLGRVSATLQRGVNARLRSRQGQDCLAVVDRSIRAAVARLWRSLQRESSGRDDTAASVEKDNPDRLLSNSQHSHHDSEVTGTLAAAYSRLKLSAPPSSPTESGAHSEDPSPGAYSAGASTPATSSIPPTPHTPQSATTAGALSPLPTPLTPTGSLEAHGDTADTYVLPPFFGPKRIWKLR